MSISNTHRTTRRLFLLGTFVTLAATACIKNRAPSVATNTPAPAFSLTDSTGKQVSLASLTARGPAVIVFYRGHW